MKTAKWIRDRRAAEPSPEFLSKLQSALQYKQHAPQVLTPQQDIIVQERLHNLAAAPPKGMT